MEAVKTYSTPFKDIINNKKNIYNFRFLFQLFQNIRYLSAKIGKFSVRQYSYFRNSPKYQLDICTIFSKVTEQISVFLGPPVQGEL